jgi:hypothetical protein
MSDSMPTGSGVRPAASSTGRPTRPLPRLPEIGQSEAWYSKHIHQAEADEDNCAREAYKVGQYITLALDPHLTWEEKLKYFHHALKRHCTPPASAEEPVATFYWKLAEMVRQYCGQEALRLASAQDDVFATRLGLGASREELEDEAEEFFTQLVPAGEQCPAWFSDQDYSQLKMIRDQWI